ncbi:MAG: hypothetical protein IJ190_02415 [Prevotella sp.]|nr:hypothetical protein [Prevotella sp.]
MKKDYNIHPAMEVLKIEISQMLAASNNGLPTELEDILKWENPVDAFLEDEFIA